MTSADPTVTVVIPTYDWSTALRYAVGSVLTQDFEDFELLVVGDGCTDDSAEVVGELAAADDRITWVGLPRNAGTQAVPNNVGLSLARGDIVAYLGHDDLWLPQHLRTVVDALQFGGAAVVHTRSALVVPGQPVVAAPSSGYEYRPGDWLAPTTSAHRRREVAELGGWRRPGESGTMDPEADLWARSAAVHGPGQVVDRVTALKLPAGLRRGVYGERPCHEQREWAARIADADDPEHLLRVMIDAGDIAEGAPPPPPPAIFADPTADAAERHRVRRRWKGLD